MSDGSCVLIHQPTGTTRLHSRREAVGEPYKWDGIVIRPFRPCLVSPSLYVPSAVMQSHRIPVVDFDSLLYDVGELAGCHCRRTSLLHLSLRFRVMRTTSAAAIPKRTDCLWFPVEATRWSIVWFRFSFHLFSENTDRHVTVANRIRFHSAGGGEGAAPLCHRLRCRCCGLQTNTAPSRPYSTSLGVRARSRFYCHL